VVKSIIAHQLFKPSKLMNFCCQPCRLVSARRSEVECTGLSVIVVLCIITPSLAVRFRQSFCWLLQWVSAQKYDRFARRCWVRRDLQCTRVPSGFWGYAWSSIRQQIWSVPSVRPGQDCRWRGMVFHPGRLRVTATVYHPRCLAGGQICQQRLLHALPGRGLLRAGLLVPG